MPFKLKLSAPALLLILISGSVINAVAQDNSESPPVFLPNQEVQVVALPTIVADSTSPSSVMEASVAIAVLEKDVCCGRNSALADQVSSSGSLKELGEKLRGKHYLDTGIPIMVADNYLPAASVNVDEIINTLMAQRPLLMDWDGHLYVVYGAVFDEYRHSDGAVGRVLHKLLLIDARFSSRRRLAVFDRQTDDWSKVTGLLDLNITR